MSLNNVSQGDPHVDAHNAERGLINALQNLTDSDFANKLSATFAPALGANIPRTLAKLRNNEALAVSIIGDSKHDPATPGNTETTSAPTAGPAMSKALTLIDAWSNSTVTVTNVAESGHTMARQFIQGNVATAVNAAPDLLVFEIGTNDSNADANGVYAAGYPMAASLAAIERAVAYARDVREGAEVLIISTTPYLPGNSANPKIVAYNEGIKSLAASLGAEYVDGYKAFTDLGDWTPQMYDSTHRNAAGNDVLAQAIVKHFPQTGPVVARGVTPRATKGKYDISKVDKSKGSLGYLTLAGPTSVPEGSYVLTGTGWTVDGSFDVTSTVGDFITITGTKVREILVNLSLEATYMPVVDFYLDGTLVNADVNLNAQSGKNTVNYWVAPFTGLDGNQHAMKIVLKSGTLRVSSSAIVYGSTTAFTQEIQRVELAKVSTSTDISSGTVSYLVNTTLNLPGGWGSAEVLLTGKASFRVAGATATIRSASLVSRIGGTVDSTDYTTFGAVASGDNAYHGLPVSNLFTMTGNTQVRVEGKAISTDKTGMYLAGGHVVATLRRTA